MANVKVYISERPKQPIALKERSKQAISIKKNSSYGPFAPFIHFLPPGTNPASPGPIIEDHLYIILNP